MESIRAKKVAKKRIDFMVKLGVKMRIVVT